MKLAERMESQPIKGWEELCLNSSKAFQTIEKNLAKAGNYIPDDNLLFRAFELCPLEKVKVVIVGQDPYPDKRNACGLSFSTPSGVRTPASLRNIYKELEREYPSFEAPEDGCLEGWAEQGVLMLNYCLTYHPNDKLTGNRLMLWMPFIRLVIDTICLNRPNTVFIMWGKKAQEIAPRIKKCKKIEGIHPSPLAGTKFVGCGHFKETNDYLEEKGEDPIDWCAL